MSAPTAATYIFTGRTCPITIITLEPCALNAEFQHFILRHIPDSVWVLCFFLLKWEEDTTTQLVSGSFKGNFVLLLGQCKSNTLSFLVILSSFSPKETEK
jgi:hypothetical protein